MEDGYYSIRPMHKLDMGLNYASGNVNITGIGTTDSLSGVTSTTRWKISYNSNGYVFMNNGTQSRALYPIGGSSSAGASVIASTYSSSNTAFSWHLEYLASPPRGVLLYDATTNASAFNIKRPIIVGETKTLSDLEIIASVYSPTTNSGSIRWETSNALVATVNSSTGTVTAVGLGSVTITAVHSTSGATASYTICGVSNIALIEVVYDSGYQSRYSNAQNRVSDLMDLVQDKYLNEFDIFIEYGAPAVFQSYADLCNSAGTSPDDLCSCSAECVNSTARQEENGNITYTLQDSHHKNRFNVFYRISLPTDGYGKVAFIGHKLCQNYGVGCTDSISNGLSAKVLNYAMINNFEGTELRTTVHELGHLFGAPDHYDSATGGIKSTSETNLYYNTNLFSADCIYGENRFNASITNNLTICAGCQSMINQNASRFSGE